jgi:hypothetical protein
LAASFATEGTRFLTDDGLLLEWVDGRCMIVPSHPSIRLWARQPGRAGRRAVRVGGAGREFHSQVPDILAGPGVAFCH